jgi:hypothetical protein
LRKKLKSAPPVTEELPEESEAAPQEAPGPAVVPEAVSPIQIPEKVLEQAKALGIDLKQVVDWALSVEQKLVIAEKNFQKIGEFLTRMEPLVKLSEQVKQQQATGATAPVQASGGFDLMRILEAITKFTGGGGGSNPLGDEITKKVIEAGLSQMFAGTKLLETIQTKMMADMGAKMVTEAANK